MSLQGKRVLLTGASMGIGEAIAEVLAGEGASLALLARSQDKLETIARKLSSGNAQGRYIHRSVDITSHSAVDEAVAWAVETLGGIDILINNAGLALGAPAAFHDLSIADITTMNNTNVHGTMFVTHSVLNRAMIPRKEGTILNITSVTGLEVPPFPGEAVYHANKACQEAFTNALRNELRQTNIRVLALRPGIVATNFHEQRVGFDRGLYDEFMDGFSPLEAKDIAEAAAFMLQQPLHRSIKALDVVPSAQRSLNVIDRTWNARNEAN